MLVLTRKVGEEIIIGDNIRVTVVAIHGNQIRLGFTAPPEVPIRREELAALPPGARPVKPARAEVNGNTRVPTPGVLANRSRLPARRLARAGAYH
jgi:carbon storage regulator